MDSSHRRHSARSSSMVRFCWPRWTPRATVTSSGPEVAQAVGLPLALAQAGLGGVEQPAAVHQVDAEHLGGLVIGADGLNLAAAVGDGLELGVASLLHALGPFRVHGGAVPGHER